MSFLYPLGLLGLIGIPILIIIYIIKNKYTEQTVSSTYIWTLSERFLKRKNPISKIAGIISLILQILAVLFLSFGIAHPVFTMHGAANRYCIALDCSGSMRTVQGDETRFDIAKDRVEEIINRAAGGSAFTLICVGDATTIYEETTDKDRVLSMLSQTQADYSPASVDNALSAMQTLFNTDSSTLNYFVTDKTYEECSNVEVIDVSKYVDNFAVGSLSYESGEKIVVHGTVTSYKSAAELPLRLDVVSGGQTYTYEQTLYVADYHEEPFEFSTELSSFESFSVTIARDDAQPLDNTGIVYSVETENTYRALLVSDEPFFLRTAFGVMENAELTVMSLAEYDEQYASSGRYPSGYGLYIYEGYSPSELPRDGAVWFFGPQGNIPGAGFGIQDDNVEIEGYGTLEYSDSTTAEMRSILNNILYSDGDLIESGTVAGDAKNIKIKSYMRCSPYGNYSVIASYQGYPVIFTAESAHGSREVVFATTFRDSDMAVSMGFLILFRNLLQYSFPAVVDSTYHVCGDTVTVNAAGNADSVTVSSPGGDVTYLAASGAGAKFTLEEVGTYTITVDVAGTLRSYRLYSAFPQTESQTSVTEASFSVAGEQTYEGYDGQYDELWYIFALLAVVLIADWVVYCYEQYQLR